MEIVKRNGNEASEALEFVTDRKISKDSLMAWDTGIGAECRNAIINSGPVSTVMKAPRKMHATITMKYGNLPAVPVLPEAESWSDPMSTPVCRKLYQEIGGKR
jgi:hypothetical protein